MGGTYIVEVIWNSKTSGINACLNLRWDNNFDGGLKESLLSPDVPQKKGYGTYFILHTFCIVLRVADFQGESNLI